MKTFLLVLLLALIVVPSEAQIIRSDSTVFKPATAWDSVYIGQAGLRRVVEIIATHLSGSSIMAYAVENDTAANAYKRMYLYPSGYMEKIIVRGSFFRRRAIGGDSCIVHTFISVREK